jgi:hypothetical protein
MTSKNAGRRYREFESLSLTRKNPLPKADQAAPILLRAINAREGGIMNWVTFFLLTLSAVVVVKAEPIAPSAIEVIDGDTIRARGVIVRLVGFDAPETVRARCDSERAMGAKATTRLKQLIASGRLDFVLVPCNCRPGTEGTSACNYGRSCGTLTVAQRMLVKR